MLPFPPCPFFAGIMASAYSRDTAKGTLNFTGAELLSVLSPLRVFLDYNSFFDVRASFNC